MEDFAKANGDGTIVGIGRHHVAHVCPPPATFRRIGNGDPARFVFDFGVGKELPGLLVQENRVVVDAVFF